MFHCGYMVLDRSADPVQISKDWLNMLKRPASFLVEPLQTILPLVISSHPGRSTERGARLKLLESDRKLRRKETG